MRHLLKPLSFLPAILMMYVIFSFSSADGVESSDLSDAKQFFDTYIVIV